MTDSVFTDISGNGLQLGGVDLAEAKGESQTSGNQITDNHLYGLPVEFHGGTAILVGYASHTWIAHNQIDHVAYSGISLGWGGWPDKKGMPAVANNSNNNVVADNLIFDFMQVLTDGGGVYTQGITGSSMANGEKVTGNVLHDQLAWGRALQADDGSTYVTYSGNALYNNNYDEGSNHIDYRYKDGRYDALSITGNYWQQGEPTKPVKDVTVTRNTLISGATGIPASIARSAASSRRIDPS